jgi:hypothetical protein
MPSSLFISGVKLLEKDPVVGGGFADIFKASYDGQAVALKRLRFFQTSQDLQGIYKV